MKYDAVIFDLDGTILETLEDLKNSLNYALKTNGLPERTTEETRSFVGNGIRNLVERAAESSDTALVDRVFDVFKEHYKEHCADKTKPYDGVVDMLTRLKEKGIMLAVLSNKADYAVQELCKKYFGNIFDAVSGEINGVARKPDPEGVYAVLKKMGAEGKNCVYVGDSEVDVKTAKNANMDCIVVDWGFRDVQALRNAGARVIVSTAEQLFDLITK